MKACEQCNGSGRLELSPCCESGYDTDIMICYECNEHIGEDDLDCENCNGTGQIKEN